MAGLAGGASAVGLIGTAMSTASNVQAADANAKILSTEADTIQQDTAFKVRQQQRQALLMQGEANATGAASGLSIKSGSPLLMELDRAKQTALETANIQRQGTLAYNAKKYQSQLVRRQIPGIIGQGVGQASSVLGTFLAR